MVFSTKFSLPSFLRQVNKLTVDQRNSIIRVGFGNLLHIPNHFLRRSQLIEMMERWNSERQAFAFPPGEITITLLDVVLILGLRVIGEPVVLEEGAPITNLEKEFGVSVVNRTISVELLKDKLESLGERDDEYFVQVFLLYCFGTLLFPSANGKVDSRYLSILQKSNNLSCFAWGAAVHQDLLDCLTQRKVKQTSNISGCLILLQIWCYEHIIIGRPKLLEGSSTFPRVCRWENSTRHYSTSSQFNINFDELEHTQILWSLKPTSEEIQVDVIKEIPQEWYLCTGLGTIEQRYDLESENTVRMVQAHREEDEEQTTILRTGFGTIEQPIDVASERASRRVRVQMEGEKLTWQERSMIVVSSDDEETEVIEELKNEILKLKVIINEQRKDSEVLKRVQDENQVLRKDNEELRKLVQELRSEGMLMDNLVSNLERIVLDENVDL